MKNLKKYFLISFLCLALSLSLGFFSTNLKSSVSADETAFTSSNPYLISTVDELENFRDKVNEGDVQYTTAYVKLSNSINLSEISDWSPIGTISSPFCGTFDGNGKTIEGVNVSYAQVIGLFGKTNGATIKDFGVSINIVISETEEEDVIIPNSEAIVGGIVGIANNTTLSASYCHVNFQASRQVRMSELSAQEFYKKIDGTEEVDVETTYLFETYLYKGQITFGGLVGQASSSIINNCYCVPQIIISQDGTNIVESSFGGIVGNISNGEICNAYVAPAEGLVSAISAMTGNLSSINAKNAAIKINSSKPSTSKVVFGGIAGVANGGSLRIVNTLFSSVVASLSATNLERGGIVGKISANSSYWPEIMYGKYLSISSPSVNIMTYSNAVGNAASVSYIPNSSVSAVNIMPTQQAFVNTWSWDDTRLWLEVTDQAGKEIWKDTSIISSMGYFFPALQKFASFTISINGSKEVAYNVSNAYLSGYYTLSFDGVDGKNHQFIAGQEVKIIAQFYSETGNQLRNFKNYFKFTSWVFGKTAVSLIDYSNEEIATGITVGNYTITLDAENGKTTISFIASAQTEGAYDVNIIGRPVTVNVEFRNSETNTKQENIGIITKKIGANIETYDSDFSFDVGEYLGGSAITLIASPSESKEYIFAGRWFDERALEEYKNSTIVLELNNENKTSTAVFYPTVVSTSEGLKTTVVAYFSNNTNTISVNIHGKGKIKLGDGEEVDSISEVVINGSELTLSAIPDEGMQFVGWFEGDEKLSSETVYKYVLEKQTSIEARFEEKPKEKTGLAWWAITLIVVVPIVVGGIIALIIIKAKRNSRRSYRRNFRGYR